MKTYNNLTIKQFDNSRGFTLIEVLVAATIISILSAIGVVGFQGATRSGRDALRKTDLEQIRSALEIYKSENSSYPPANGCQADFITSGYINPYPADPKDPTYNYCYQPLTSLTYELCAHLENGDTVTDYCGGGNNCVVNCNYRVINP